ncbi:MAG TPA: hypothetical protein VEZ90_12170 [Blastocatellia bacterium]|nr:hypothetical protein [Blastocatellia bacterium]
MKAVPVLTSTLAFALTCLASVGSRHWVQPEMSQKPNFSGAWKPDPSKTTRKRTLKDTAQKDLSPPPPPDDDDEGLPTITIQHQDPKFSETTTSADGEDVSISNLTTDGQENTNPVDEGNTYNKSKSHWEGAKLVTEWVIEQYGRPIAKGTDVRYLLDDGKNMAVDRRVETDAAVIEVHQAFVRVK